MAAKASAPGATPSPGLLGSLRNFAASMVAVAQTRLELLSTEVEEEWLRLLHMLVGTFIAMFFFALGIVILTGLVVNLFWDTHRILVAVLFSIFYLSLGVAFSLAVRAKAREKSKLFSASVAELAKDRQLLTSADADQPD